MHLLNFTGLFNKMVLLPVLKLSGIRPGQEQSPFTVEELGALRPVMKKITIFFLILLQLQ